MYLGSLNSVLDNVAISALVCPYSHKEAVPVYAIGEPTTAVSKRIYAITPSSRFLGGPVNSKSYPSHGFLRSGTFAPVLTPGVIYPHVLILRINSSLKRVQTGIEPWRGKES